MGAKDKNYLLEKIVEIIRTEQKGKVLDLGCGDGDYSVRLQELGFDVIAGDMDVKRFKHADKIDFRVCDLTQRLPFEDGSFDHILLAEVIEHLRNPYDVMKELSRVLKKGGKLIVSTPNILNLKSRVRFLIEGCWEFFRETPLEHSLNPKEVIWNVHLIPWRYHELEYLLKCSGLLVEGIHTSIYEGKGYSFLVPAIKFQLQSKQNRALRSGGMDQSRINKILLSKEVLFGRHLILKTRKD
jgi:SAM-dependent methyltransferase